MIARSAIWLLAMGVLLSACESEGPAEKAGEKIDQAVEEASEKIDDAAERTGEKIEEVGDKVREKTN